MLLRGNVQPQRLDIAVQRVDELNDETVSLPGARSTQSTETEVRPAILPDTPYEFGLIAGRNAADKTESARARVFLLDIAPFAVTAHLAAVDMLEVQHVNGTAQTSKAVLIDPEPCL